MTPGTTGWTVVPYGDGDSLVIHADSETRVCFMATPGDSPGAMARIEAWAALIASAPAMRAALRAGSDALHNAVLALALQLSPDHEDAYAGAKALAVMEAALRLAQGDGGRDE